MKNAVDLVLVECPQRGLEVLELSAHDPYTVDQALGDQAAVRDLIADQAAYIQVWGFVEGQNTKTDEMTLLSELPVTTLGDSWISAGMEPRRSP